MDEVLFHASQRLDALQIRVLCSLQNFRNVVQVYSEQLQNAALEALNSNRAISLQTGLNNVWTMILDLGSEIKHAANRERLYDIYARIVRVLAADAYATNVSFGCICFVIGGALGFTIGLSWQRRPSYIQRMKAVGCSYYGGIDAVQVLDDIPVPSIRKPDELLIQVRAAGVDPVDIRICSGYGRLLRRQLRKYNANLREEFPVILGRDCTGIVAEIGQHVNNFDIGDEVWFAVPHWLSGTLAEFVVVKESFVARKPKGIRFEVAASLPYSGLIAWDAVVSQAHLTSITASTKRVLVHTGSTAVGVMVVQLAQLRGAHVTVTCPQRAVPVAQALGADCIIYDQHSDIVKQLSDLDRFDFVFNTVGLEADEMCQKFCKGDGTVITTVGNPVSSDNYGILLSTLYSLWIRLVCFLRRSVGANAWITEESLYLYLNELGKLVEDGSLQPVVDKIFSPQDAELAFQHVDSSDAIGKTIIRFRSQTRGNSITRKKSRK